MAALQKIEVLGIRHTYVEYMVGGVLTFKRVWMTQKTDIKVTTAKLEYAGDAQKYHRNYGYMLEGSIEVDMEDNVIDGILWNTPQVSPVGGDDFSARFIKGTDNEMTASFVGVRVTLDASDADTGALMAVRYRILKVQFDPEQPPAFQSQKNAGRSLKWSARRALTTIDGVSPTGMPARGAFWIKDILTNAAAFDPVAGEIL